MRFTLAVLLISFLLLGFTQAEKCSVGCTCPWKAAFFKVPRGSCKRTKISIAKTYNTTLSECRAKGLCKPEQPEPQPPVIKCGKGRRFSPKSHKCVLKKCPKFTVWSIKSKRCIVRFRCPQKGQRFSRKLKKCVERKCGKGLKWNNKQRKCIPSHCLNSQFWSKKLAKCVTKKCPKRYRWSKKLKKCLYIKRCPKFARWSKKSKRCINRQRCGKGTTYSRKAKLCVADKCAAGQRFSKKQNKCVVAKCKKYQQWSPNQKKCVHRTCPKGYYFSQHFKRCRTKRCPKFTKWSRKQKRCINKIKCAKGQYFSIKQKKCVARKCGKGTEYNKLLQKCVQAKCKRSQEWSNKTKTCVPRKCPKNYKWSNESNKCKAISRCPKNFKWSTKVNRCVNKFKCPAGQYFSHKQNKCAPRKCPGLQRYSKRFEKCLPTKCKRSHRWSKKQNKCIRRTCPKGFFWSKKSHKCMKSICPRGYTWGKKSRRCYVKCPPGQKFYKSQKKCLTRRCAKGLSWSKIQNKCEPNVCPKGFFHNKKIDLCVLKKRCPVGFQWNKVAKKCNRKPCPEKERFSIKQKKCVAIKCPEGHKWSKKSNLCVAIQCPKNQRLLYGKCFNKCPPSWRFSKKALKCVQVKPPVTTVTCQLITDSHARAFGGQNFDTKSIGDWVLYQGDQMTVSYRGKQINKNFVGAVKWLVKVNGDVVASSGFYGITINNQKVELKDNVRHPLKGGAFVSKSGAKYLVSTKDNEEQADFVSFGYFFNLYIRSQAKTSKGICSHQFIPSNDFPKPTPPVHINPPKPKCPNRAEYRVECMNGKLTGKDLQTCIHDKCAGIPYKIIQQTNNDNGNSNQVKIVRVTCQLYADPHARDFKNEYFNAQTAGDWLLYKGQNLKVAYRGKRMSPVWVGIVGFVVRIRNDVIRSLGFVGVTLDGKKLPLIDNKEYPLPNGGFIKKSGITTTFSTGDGEEVDFINYGWFYNAYVRSTTQFKSSGICDHEFIKSNAFMRPKPPVILPPHKPKCPNKALFERECAARGLKGIPLEHCVVDRCEGLPWKIEQHIVNTNHQQDKKPPPAPKPKPATVVRCDIYADPHVHGLNNKYYNAQTPGDWVLYQGQRLEAHYRGKMEPSVCCGAWVGIIEYIVKIDGHILRSVGFGTDVTLDGKPLHLNNGNKVELGNKAAVSREGNRFTFTTGDGEEVDFIAYSYFYNGYVRTTYTQSKGICAENFIRSTAFNNPVKPHPLPPHKDKPCPQRPAYELECKRHGLIGVALAHCVEDRCHGFPDKFIKKIVKEKKQQEIKKPKRAQPVSCELYADPHVHNFNNHYYSNQVPGDWVLYRGDRMEVHYRGRSFGVWVGVIDYIVKIDGQVLRAVGFGGVSLNGHELNLINGQRYNIGKGAFVHKLGNTITFSTNDGEDVDFISFGWFYNVNVRSTALVVSGICAKSTNFERSTAFENPVVSRTNHHQHRDCARRPIFEIFCRRFGLNPAAHELCVRDRCAGFNARDLGKIIRNNVNHKFKGVHINKPPVVRVAPRPIFHAPVFVRRPVWHLAPRRNVWHPAPRPVWHPAPVQRPVWHPAPRRPVWHPAPRRWGGRWGGRRVLDVETNENTENFIGCFKDAGNRDLPIFRGNKSYQDCKRDAEENGFEYFGMQWPQGCAPNQAQCFVGNSYGKYGKSPTCWRKDSQNHEMGDAWVNAIYKAQTKPQKVYKNFIGCYKDAGNRDLPIFTGNKSYQDCKKFADENGFKYFGMQWPQGCAPNQAQCFVGNSYGKYGKSPTCWRKDSQSHEMGDAWVNAIYKAKPQPQKVYKNFIGCYKDTGNRDLPIFRGNKSYQDCKKDAEATGYQYFGMQWPQGCAPNQAQCFVGNSYGKYGKSPTCWRKDSQSHEMGDAWVNAVYKAEYEVPNMTNQQAQCYLDRYIDLQKAFGPHNIEAAKQHWRTYGYKEKRHKSCKGLDSVMTNEEAQCYLNRYPDLQKAFGPHNIERAKQHWREFGFFEKRDKSCKGLGSPLTDQEAQCYLDRYPDLQKAFGPHNIEAAKQHWIVYGFHEKRHKSCRGLDSVMTNEEAQCYLNRYPDLQKAFGPHNIEAAKQHWREFGFFEKRNKSCDAVAPQKVKQEFKPPKRAPPKIILKPVHPPPKDLKPVHPQPKHNLVPKHPVHPPKHNLVPKHPVHPPKHILYAGPRRGVQRRVLYKFGEHLRTLCRKGIVLNKTPRKMISPLWSKYISILSGKSKYAAKHTNKKLVSLYIKNLLKDQCQPCECSSLFKGAKLRQLKKLAKDQCQ